MAREKGKNGGAGHAKKRAIDRYEHTGKKRVNNPPVGLVTPQTDPPLPTHKIYDYIQPVPGVKPGKELNYDPHLDPQLAWAGKKEHYEIVWPNVIRIDHEYRPTLTLNLEKVKAAIMSRLGSRTIISVSRSPTRSGASSISSVPTASFALETARC